MPSAQKVFPSRSVQSNGGGNTKHKHNQVRAPKMKRRKNFSGVQSVKSQKSTAFGRRLWPFEERMIGKSVLKYWQEYREYSEMLGVLIGKVPKKDGSI